jgi:hypothetical protein
MGAVICVVADAGHSQHRVRECRSVPVLFAQVHSLFWLFVPSKQHSPWPAPRNRRGRQICRNFTCKGIPTLWPPWLNA